MPDALDKALANASLNARMNGDTLHTENLDSIADPTFDQPIADTGYTYDQFDPNRDGVLTSKAAFPNPRTEFELLQNYQQQMESEYKGKMTANNATTSSIHHLLVLAQAISDKTNWIQQHLIDLTIQVSRIETTITTAAQSMSPNPSHNHRSLHEWDDSTLLNELVERENDLMPFYFELLKRIPQNLQGHVDESMKGKYQSLGVLSKLCAALSYVQQPQPTQAQQMSDIIQQLNQPSAEDIARANRNPDKYGSPTYPQSDNQPTILNEYRAVPKLPFVNGMINPYPQS